MSDIKTIKRTFILRDFDYDRDFVFVLFSEESKAPEFDRSDPFKLSYESILVTSYDTSRVDNPLLLYALQDHPDNIVFKSNIQIQASHNNVLCRNPNGLVSKLPVKHIDYEFTLGNNRTASLDCISDTSESELKTLQEIAKSSELPINLLESNYYSELYWATRTDNGNIRCKRLKIEIEFYDLRRI